MAVKIPATKSSGWLLTIILTFFCFHTEAQQPSIHYSPDSVWVDGLNEEILYTFLRYNSDQQEWRSVFPVRVADSKTDLSGRYRFHRTSVAFVPTHRFITNVNYTAAFHYEALTQNPNEVYLPPADASIIEITFRFDVSSRHPPEVVAIYPTTDTVPENLLRFHIHFSNAMKRGEAYELVKLFDQTGKEVEKAFLIVDEELWDDDMKALTLMLDPGRIKRGLRANLEMNAPLTAGLHYSLQIGGGWQDVNQTAMAEPVIKHFVCAKADRTLPDVSRWRVVAPDHSSAALTIIMDEPLDHELPGQALKVENQRGQPIAGTIEIGNNDRLLIFKPSHDWIAGKYTIRINPKVEDLAGNNLNRLFDTDLSAAEVSRLNSPSTLAFRYKESRR